MTARTHCVVVPVLLLAACSLEGTPEVPEGTVRDNAVSDVVQFRGRVHFRAQGVDCIDQDGDGAGAYCSGGADCDDTDPSVQTGCTDCADPAAGCPCALDAPDVACTVRLGGDCMQGSLRCQDGRYACSELGPLDREIAPGESNPAGFRRYAFTGDPCDSCDLTCRNDPRVPGCPGINPDAPCTTSATCSLGRVCDRGYCSCTSNAQCPAGQQCIGSYCIAPASCSGDPTPDETFDHVGYDPMPPGGFRPGITIGRGTTVFSRYAWVANSGQNTVSKVCLEECPDAWNPMLMHPAGSEVGRYLVGYDGISNNPSRTAIDGLGNAYVANRAHSSSNQGSVTAFAGDWSYCDPMRNGDMVLRTSTGGLTGTANWLSRLTAGLPTDECVRWTIPIGANGYTPRALTIGPARPGQNAPGGWVYVGTWNRRACSPWDGNCTWVSSPGGPGRVYKVHPSGCVANRTGCEPATGNWAASGTTAPNGGSVLIPLHPYGAVSFEDGDIWLAQIGTTGWTAVNTDDGTTTPWFTPPAGSSPSQLSMMNAGYGISQDQHHRVWQSGWDEQAMTFYDPGVRDALAASTPLNTALTSTAGDSWCHVDLSASQTESLNYSGGLGYVNHSRGITGDNTNNFSVGAGVASVGSQWMSFWYGGATIMTQVRTPNPSEGCPYCTTWREYRLAYNAGNPVCAANWTTAGCYGFAWIERTGTAGSYTRVCANSSCSVVLTGWARLTNGGAIASVCTAYSPTGGGPRGFRDWRFWGDGLSIARSGTSFVFVNSAGTTWPLGVGLDPAARPITINSGSNNASLVDVAASTWWGSQNWLHYPTTVPRFNSIYTYSDFTGSLRDMFSDPMGTYSKRYECGPMEVGVWGDLTWDTTVPAMPPGMEIVIMVRVGSTIPELDAATAHEIVRIRMTDPEQGMTNIATELEAFIGAMASRRRYLEVQFLLVRPAGETLSPVVHDFNLDWRCVPVF